MPELDGSEQVADEYEVVEGYHHVRDASGRSKRYGPGDRFHPTRKQVESNSLEGKARKVRDAYEPTTTQGADIGLRSLPMTDAALELALDEGLSEEDFEDIEPDGVHGDYLKGQVEDLVGD